MEIAVGPDRVFAGDSVFLTSAQFRAVPDSQIYVSMIDSADRGLPVRRLDDTTVVFDAPAVLTGSYAFRVELLGGGASADTFVLAVAGVAQLTWLGRTAFVPNLLALADGRVVYHGTRTTDSRASYVVLDPVDGTEWVGAQDTVAGRPMYAPGPSFRPGHVVLDFSEARNTGPSAAAAWLLDASQRTLTSVRPLPCGEPLYASYTAAELSDSTCLWLTYPDSVMRNASTPVRIDRGLGGGEFRIGPGAQRTVIVQHDWRYGDLRGDWPVFDRNGDVAWAVARYGQVTGAAFSPGGDTLFVVARDKSTDSTWTLDLFDAAAGTPLATIALPELRDVWDVFADPVTSRLYVAGRRRGEFFRILLVVLERATLARLATIPAPLLEYGADVGVLTSGLATGRVHLILVSPGDRLGNMAFDVP